jgi:hypothetical protein
MSARSQRLTGERPARKALAMIRRITLSLFVASSVTAALVALAAPRSPSSVDSPPADTGRDAHTLDVAREASTFDALRDAPVSDARGDVFRLEAAVDAPGLGGAVPACITWWTEARYRPFGYDHIVHLKSACTRPADCTISTNVNPEVKRVLVPVAASVEVYTFLMSPAREFTAYVECKLRS